MKYIKKFETEAKYKDYASNINNRPNISLITTNNKTMNFVKVLDGFEAIINVTDTSTDYVLFHESHIQKIYKLYIDDVETTPVSTTKFSTTGTYTIKIEYADPINLSPINPNMENFYPILMGTTFNNIKATLRTPKIMDALCCTCVCDEIDVSNVNTSNCSSISHAFFYASPYTTSSLTIKGLDKWNTSKIRNMSGLFYNTPSLNSASLSGITNWDTSEVTDMSYMFVYCGGASNLNLSNWNTSNVTDMSMMFYNCHNLNSLDISNFDTSKVTNMYGMFGYCAGLTSLDLSNFDTGNVTNMGQMFYECGSLTSLDLSNFDTSKVTDMNQMFSECSGLTSIDLSKWDTSNVTNMRETFKNCTSLTEIKLGDVSNVTDFTGIFDGIPSSGKMYLNVNYDYSTFFDYFPEGWTLGTY